MTARNEGALQMPADFSEWVRTLDLSDDETPEQEQEETSSAGYAIGGGSDPNDIGVIWASRPPDADLESERLKIGLLHQHHLDAYGEDDPRSDEELWSAYREAIGGGE